MALQSPHDALFRAAFESPRHAAQLLHAVLPAELTELVSLDSLELEPGGGRGQNLEEFRTDLLFRANIANAPGFICVLFEHQSSSDHGMPLRMLGYLLRTWERAWRSQRGRPLPPIIPIVISHDPNGWRAPLELADLLPMVVRHRPALRSVTPNFRYILDDLTQLSDSKLRARALAPFPTLALWALRDARTPGQILHTLDQWADALTNAANAPNGRDALQQLFLYISTVAENLAFDQFKSRVLQHSPATEPSFMTIAEELRERGLQQGIERGLQQGALQTRREDIESLLTSRFGTLPAAVTARIQSADADTLKRWLNQILTGASPEAVVEL